jgi:hypothetical protein
MQANRAGKRSDWHHGCSLAGFSVQVVVLTFLLHKKWQRKTNITPV